MVSAPDVARQEQRAAAELAKILRPRLVAGCDADDIATRFIADLRANGWRPTLPVPDWRQPRTGDPETNARGAALARQALAGQEFQ